MIQVAFADVANSLEPAWVALVYGVSKKRGRRLSIGGGPLCVLETIRAESSARRVGRYVHHVINRDSVVGKHFGRLAMIKISRSNKSFLKLSFSSMQATTRTLRSF